MNRRNESEDQGAMISEMPRRNVLRQEYDSEGPVGNSRICEDRQSEPQCEAEAPTPVAVGQIRDISIEPLNYGYIVKVGCQKLAFETYEKLISCLTDYMKDPAGIEKAWFAGEYLRKNK